MLKPLALTALLALSACANLTGDPKADCPAANLAVLQAQQAVIATEVIAAETPSADANHAVVFAKAYLASALATQAVACAAPI